MQPDPDASLSGCSRSEYSIARVRDETLKRHSQSDITKRGWFTDLCDRISRRGRAVLPLHLPFSGTAPILRHAEVWYGCRLSGRKRKSLGHCQTVAIDPSRTERPRDRCYRIFFCIERAHAEKALIDASFGCPDRCTR